MPIITVPGVSYGDKGDLTSGGDITTIDISAGKSKECHEPPVVNDTSVFKNGQPLAHGDNK